MTVPYHRPVVLVLGGSDPTGGAGTQADIETIFSMACHPAAVIAAVTAQDTKSLKQYSVIESALVIAQARAVLEDMPVAAVKTGMLGNRANLVAAASILEQYSGLPLVVDPVEATTRGEPLTEEPLDDALHSLLLPRATLLTVTSLEARRLAPDADSIDACAQELMSLGCEHVLITGRHEHTQEVQSRLYGNMRLLKSFSYERLKHDCHGGGCTLAAACAAGFAHGLDPVSAVHKGLEYTWNTLRHGFRAGGGLLLPDRLYWAQPPVHRDETK